jgi:hypothetical protein
VHLANTAAIKKYDRLKHRGDETDALYLAHLLRLGILPTGPILPPETRSVRDLVRKRMQFVRSRVTHVIAIENISARQYGARLSGALVRDLTNETIDQMGLPADVALPMQANLAVVNALDADSAGEAACRNVTSANLPLRWKVRFEPVRRDCARD